MLKYRSVLILAALKQEEDALLEKLQMDEGNTPLKEILLHQDLG